MAQNSCSQVIHIQSVSFRYGRQGRGDLGALREYAVQDAELVLHRGQVTALVGANGSGKSTLLKILLGQAQPCCGTVDVWAGSPPRVQRLWGPSLRPRHLGQILRVGYVAQSNSLDGRLSVAQNLDLAGQMYGLTPADRRRRASELLSFFGLSDFAGVPVVNLSGGQRRRADVARAMMPDPELLVLDEAGTGLDRQGLSDLGELVAQQLKGGRADSALACVLMVTHLDHDLELADSMVLMEQGRTLRQVARDELLRAEPLERIVLTIRRGSLGEALGDLGALKSHLSDIVGSDLVAMDPLRETTAMQTGDETIAIGLSVKRARSVLPKILAAHWSVSIEAFELRPESLAARLRRSVA
jgi:ABC-type multidrug transport system ATPase subunit